ncbi:MAG: hypothetical protein RJB26_2497 [Pseudomonadota bacterium]|jgi:diguanylate cyclase (GGDEF)-like protein/PAS domain S-box-containing protein
MLTQPRLLFDATPWLRVALMLFLMIIATAMRYAGLPPVDAGAPFVTYTPVVFFAFLFLGRVPARLSVVLAAVGGYVLFAAPYGSLAWKPVPLASLAVMTACALLLDYALEGQRRATTRLYGVLASLRESEQRYFGMVNDQAEAIGRTDSEGCVVFVNEAFCQLLGVSRTELLGKPWRSFVVNEDRAGAQAEVARLTPERSVAILEHRFRDVAGVVRWGRFVHRGIFRGDGRLLEVETLAHDITERKALEQRLRTTTDELRDLYDNAPCAYYALDMHGNFLHLNNKTEEWLGCPGAEMIGRLGPVDFVSAEDRKLLVNCFPVFKQTGIIDGLEFELISRQGVKRRVRLQATAIYDGMGTFKKSRSIMHDVTDVHLAQQRLQALAAEQRAILDNEIVGMVKTRGGRAVWRNRAVETMFGFSAAELQARGSRVLYASDAEFEAVKQEAAGVLRTAKRFHTQVRLVRKDGSRVWVDLSAALVGPGEVVWSFVDVTPLVAREEQARFMAHRDVLTGLPNRRQFDTSAAEILAEARTSGHKAALCYLDLDGFKPVNDLHGHAAGDLLLQEMARRMTQCLRGKDVVFRFGGDEFVLLLPQVKDDATCSMVLARLLAAIEQEMTLPSGATVGVTASVGAALLGEAGDSLDELLPAADAAMYLAKQSAGSSLRFATRKPVPVRLAALT